MAGNFVEVWLAKEGHDGLVGINFLDSTREQSLVIGTTDAGNAPGVALEFNGQPVDLGPYTQSNRTARLTLPLTN